MGVVDKQRLLNIVQDGKYPFLVEWAILYGLAHYPSREARQQLIEAALALMERDSSHSMARQTLQVLNDEKAWSRDMPNIAARLRALINKVEPRTLPLALDALVCCEGDAALDVCLDLLDGNRPARAKAAAYLMPAFCEGPGILAEKIAQNQNLKEFAARDPYLLLGKGWTQKSVAAALAGLTLEKDERDRHKEKERHEIFLRTFEGHVYECGDLNSPTDAEKWAETAARECKPLLSRDLALRVAKALNKGKGPGAMDALRGAFPKSIFNAPKIEDERPVALARCIVKTIWSQNTLRDRLARTCPARACVLLAAALARLLDQEASPATDSATATLEQALEAIQWPRPNIRDEAGWIKRVASFGTVAIQPLANCLKSETEHVAWRAAMALSSIQDIESLRALSQAAVSPDQDLVLGFLERMDRALLARMDTDALREALAQDDIQKILEILNRWKNPSRHSEELVSLLVPHSERIVFEENCSAAFTSFVASNPDPRFMPLADLWRPGQVLLGEMAMALLAANAPGDPRLNAIHDTDAAVMDKRIQGRGNQDHLLLPLRCRHCKAVYDYEVYGLYMSRVSERSELPPMHEYNWIEDEIICKRCGAIDEYEWSSEADRICSWQLLAARGGLHPAIIPVKLPPPLNGLTLTEMHETLSQRVAANADDVQSLLHLASVNFNMGLSAQALEICDRVLTRWPQQPEALYERGVILLRQRKYMEALDDFTRAALLYRFSDPEKLELSLRTDLHRAAQMAGRPVPLEPLQALDEARLKREAHGSEDSQGEGFPISASRAKNQFEITHDDFDDDSLDTDEDDSEFDEEDGDAAEDRGISNGGEEPKKPKGVDTPARLLTHDLLGKIMDYGRHRPQLEWNRALSQWLGRPASFAQFLQEHRELSDDLGFYKIALISQFLDYRIHDWRASPSEKTLAQLFKETEWLRLARAEQTQLNDWLERRHFGWYRIEAIDTELSLATLKDCMNGETFQVYDQTLTRTSTAGKMLLGAVFMCAGQWEMNGFNSVVADHVGQPFETWLKDRYEQWSASASPAAAGNASIPAKDGTRKFFHDQAAEIRLELQRLMSKPPLCLMPTGEPFCPQVSCYEILDRKAVRAALINWPEPTYDGWQVSLGTQGESYLLIHKKGNPPHPFGRSLPTSHEADGRKIITNSARVKHLSPRIARELKEGDDVYGNIMLSSDQLIFAAASKERHDFVRDQLLARLKSSVKFLITHTQEGGPK